MTKYGLDLEKVEIALKEVLQTGDAKQIAAFAQDIIPRLLEDARNTRQEVMDLLLGIRPFGKK